MRGSSCLPVTVFVLLELLFEPSSTKGKSQPATPVLEAGDPDSVAAVAAQCEHTVVSQGVSEELEVQPAATEVLSLEVQPAASGSVLAVPLGPAPHAALLPVRLAAPPLPDATPDMGGAICQVDLEQSSVVHASDGHVVSNQAQEVLSKLLTFARSIRQPGSYIGHSAFILFALSRRKRLYVWEGGERIYLLHTYATWACDMCSAAVAADAVACACIVKGSGQIRDFAPIGDAHPLHTCRHWLSAVHIGEPLDDSSSEIVSYYSKMGLAILGTVTNGDCGIDVMCLMAGEEETAANRARIREDSQGEKPNNTTPHMWELKHSRDGMGRMREHRRRSSNGWKEGEGREHTRRTSN